MTRPRIEPSLQLRTADPARLLLRALTLLFVSALVSCAGRAPQPTPSPLPTAEASVPPPTASPVETDTFTGGRGGQFFDVASLPTTAGGSVQFTSLLDVESMKVGVYQLQEGTVDPQDTHRLDEIYVVLEGSAVLHTAESDMPVAEGSIVFVRGGVSHRFEQIADPLTVVVLFAKAAGGPDEPSVLTADASALVEGASPTANLWRRFLKVSSLTGGAYLLPMQRGGDRSQTHQVDELNVVLSGSGVLRVGSEDFSYGPGNLIFVPAQVGHAFHDLASDSVVLIFWPANP